MVWGFANVITLVTKLLQVRWQNTKDPNKRTKEMIRCSENWRQSGKTRHDFIWVQEYGCLDKSTSEVEGIQGRMIGRSILFFTIKDVESGRVLEGEVL